MTECSYLHIGRTKLLCFTLTIMLNFWRRTNIRNQTTDVNMLGIHRIVNEYDNKDTERRLTGLHPEENTFLQRSLVLSLI